MTKIIINLRLSILTFFLVISYLIVHSQGRTRNIEVLKFTHTETVYVDERDRGLKYTIEVTKDWVLADIITKSYGKLQNVLIKYDPHYKVIFLKLDQEVHTLKTEEIASFVLKTEIGERSFDNFIIEDNKQEFLEKIYIDKITLYKRYATSYQKAHYNKLLDAGSHRDQILVKERFYLSYTDGKMEMVPYERRKIMNLLLAKKPSVRSFIKGENLNVKDVDDLIKIIAYLSRDI